MCKVGQPLVYSHFFFQLLVGEGSSPIFVVPGSVIAHPFPNFLHFHLAHSCRVSTAGSGSLLYWVIKEKEGNVTGIEALLHVGHFIFIG